ncbi:MAG: hypothetical protein WA970_17360 [Gammaproteobacteria bacterium]
MATANTIRIQRSSEQAGLTPRHLARENQIFGGTGGVSQGNQQYGFRPAFLEAESGEIYLSRFADGRPAPVHVLDGLPSALVTKRTATGRVIATRGSIISGFVCAGQFYTREQTAKLTTASA